jgi:hypothetical protein
MGFNPKIKPRQWGPIDAMVRAVRRYYEDTYGILPPLLYFPGFGPGDQINFGSIQYKGLDSGGVGFEGNRIKFDGSNDFVKLESLPRLDLQALLPSFTLLMRINAAAQADKRIFSWGGPSTGVLAIGSDPSSPYQKLNIYQTTGGEFGYSGWTGKKSTGAVFTGADKNIALSFEDGQYFDIYIDGKLDSSHYRSLSGSPGAATPYITLGAYRRGSTPSGSSFLAGGLDNVKIFSPKLTANQIALQHEQPFADIQPRSIPSYFFVSGGGGGGTVSGALDASLSAMISSFPGKLGVGGSVSTIAGNTSLSNSGREGKQGELFSIILSIIQNLNGNSGNLGSFLSAISLFSLLSGGNGNSGLLSTDFSNTLLSSLGKKGDRGDFVSSLSNTTVDLNGKLGNLGSLSTIFSNILIDLLSQGVTIGTLLPIISLTFSLSSKQGVQGSLPIILSNSQVNSEGKVGYLGILNSIFSSLLSVAGNQGVSGSLETGFSLIAFFDEKPLVYGSLSTVVTSMLTSISGKSGINAELVLQNILVAAIVGKLGLNSSFTISLEDVAQSIGGAVGSVGTVSASLTVGAEVSAKLGLSGSLAADLQDLQIVLLEVTIDGFIYQIVVSTQTGEIVLLTKTDSISVSTINFDSIT